MIRPTPSTLRLATRQLSRQQRPLSSSIRSGLRNAARETELHPLERLPTKTKSQGADWGKMGKRDATQAILFFPAFGIVLGWPMLAKMAFDQSGGYEVPESLRLQYQDL